MKKFLEQEKLKDGENERNLEEISLMSENDQSFREKENKQDMQRKMHNITQIGLNLLKENINPRKDELILNQLPKIKQFTLKQVQ